MSDAFDPDAYLAAKTGEAFDPDAYLAAKGVSSAPPPPESSDVQIGPFGVPTRFLDFLKSKWSGEKAPTGLPAGVRRVETPTGPTHLTADGAPFLPPEEAEQMADANAAKFKQRVLEGGLSTLSGGGKLADEMSGAMKVPGAIDQYVSDTAFGRPTTSPLDVYRRERDSVRSDVDSATRNASPTFELGGQQVPVLPLVGASIPSMLAPLPVGAGARILGGGVTSALDALGGSEADVTRGDVGGLFSDAGSAALFGAGASGVAEGGGQLMRSIGRGAVNRLGGVVSAQAVKDADAVAANVASLRGEAGRASSALNRAGENTRGIIGGLPPPGATAIDPALHSKALLQLSEPGFVAAQSRTLANTLEDLPSTVSRDQAAQAAYHAALASQGADATKRTADFFAKPTLTTDVLPRVGRQLQNAAIGTATSIPAAVAGGLGFGQVGAGAMLALGASQGLSKGALTAARTTLANPRLQAGALGVLSDAAQAGAGGMSRVARTAPVVTNTAGQNAQKAQQNAFEALAARFGINAKSKEELANEAFVKGQTGQLDQ